MDDLTQIAEAVEKQGQAFEEFKATNDKRLDEIKANGTADPLTEEKLARMDEFFDGYEDLNQKLTAAAKASDQREADLTDQLEAIEVALKRTIAGGTEEVTSDELKAFETWARFGSIMDPNHHQKSISADELKAMTASDDTTGGYFAPAEYVREIIKNITEVSPVRQLVRVRPTGNRSVQLPKRTGQFAAVWVGEIQSRSETDGLRWGLEEIPTHELTAEAYISMQDLEDSIFNLEAELNSEFTEQFALAEGTAVVTGSGSNRPEGWNTNADVGETISGAAAAIASSNSGTAEADGLIDLQAAIKTGYQANANWVMNRTSMGSVRKLKDSQNNYVWRLGIAEGAPNTILGAPYVEIPDMPNEGANAYPIAYGDFRRAYTLIDRLRISVLRDPFTMASTGLIKFVARRRVGGQVTQAEAIRKLKCAAS
jgi:HK97 family phage major capsid protein